MLDIQALKIYKWYICVYPEWLNLVKYGCCIHHNSKLICVDPIKIGVRIPHDWLNFVAEGQSGASGYLAI